MIFEVTQDERVFQYANAGRSSRPHVLWQSRRYILLGIVRLPLFVTFVHLISGLMLDPHPDFGAPFSDVPMVSNTGYLYIVEEGITKMGSHPDRGSQEKEKAYWNWLADAKQARLVGVSLSGFLQMRFVFVCDTWRF